MTQPSQSRLTVLLMTDIVGSTDLKSRIGLASYARLLAMHDGLFGRLIDEYPTAEILKDTGDGYFASFSNTTDAVRFALRFQDALQRALWDPQPLKVRIGIHLGEVAQLEKETTGKPKIVGLAADLVSRVAGLADGGQILLTRSAFNEARQFVSTAPNSEQPLHWVAHGPYRLRGADEAIEIFEVGVQGIAPLHAPGGNNNARRAVALDDEQTLGWRPAVGLPIPGRPDYWVLERRLGEGAFGEVWLARHTKLAIRRVFKFCFDADRLRSFKRELTLFRLLHDTLGKRSDIARIHEVKLDEPPYFLESEYTEGGNLEDWCEAQGGVEKVPLETRIDLVTRVSEAVAAAHSVGVLHKDIKPANILIADENGQPRPQLADFGIGILTDRARLDGQHAITVSGFTGMTRDQSSQTGTRIYLPPEVLVGKPFTVQGDIYALGVLLYQLVVADLNRPLAEGWQREIDDALLREDIAACVQGDPSRRLASAAELASRLSNLPRRREQRRREIAENLFARRRQKLARMLFVVLLVLSGVILVLSYAFYTERSLRASAERLRSEAEAARRREADQHAIADGVGQFLMNMLLSVSPDSHQGRDVTVLQAIDVAARQLDDPQRQWHPEVEAYLRNTLGLAYRVLGEPQLSEPQLQKASEMIAKIKGPDDTETHNFRAEWAKSLGNLGEHERAAQILGESIQALIRIEGPNSGAALSFMNDRAQNLMQAGKLDEAEPIVQHLVEARRREYGPDAPETLAVMNTYAGLLFERGLYAQARDQFQAVYDARAKTSGPEHALTLVAAQNLASLKHRTGDTLGGHDLMERVVEAQRRTVGPEHSRTLDAMINLSQMKQALLRSDEAIELLRQVIEIRQRKLGSEHPDTLRAMSNLGNLLAASETRYPEAEPVLRETLAIAEKTLPADSPQRVLAQASLAKTLGKLGRASEAEALYRQTLETSAQAHGPKHPITGSYHLSFGGFLLDQKRYHEAEEQCLVALGIATSPDTPNPTQEGVILARLVRIAEAMPDAAKAATYTQRLASHKARFPATTRSATSPSNSSAGL